MNMNKECHANLAKGALNALVRLEDEYLEAKHQVAVAKSVLLAVRTEVAFNALNFAEWNYEDLCAQLKAARLDSLKKLSEFVSIGEIAQ